MCVRVSNEAMQGTSPLREQGVGGATLTRSAYTWAAVAQRQQASWLHRQARTFRQTDSKPNMALTQTRCVSRGGCSYMAGHAGTLT